jgi:hypothetical protein
VKSYAYFKTDDGQKKWPWRVNVELDEAYVRDFIHDGVPLDVLNVDGRDFGMLMRRRSHMKLSDEEYQAALDALRR